MPVIGVELVVLVVAAVILLVLGPKKIPELARGIGKAIAEYRKAKRENDESDSLEGGS